MMMMRSQVDSDSHSINSAQNRR